MEKLKTLVRLDFTISAFHVHHLGNLMHVGTASGFEVDHSVVTFCLSVQQMVQGNSRGHSVSVISSSEVVSSSLTKFSLRLTDG